MTALACAFASHTHAGSFDVNPIRIDLSGSARNAALTLKNNGSEAVVVQINVMSWAQRDGKDILNPTDEILVSPPIATIQPEREQIIRVGLRRAPDTQKEISYRLFLQEVPPPPAPGFQGLQVALRIGIPIFVQPRQGPAKATLVWDAQLRTADVINLKLRNDGTGHIQVSDVELYLRDEKEPIAAQSSLAYVLPGQSREWDLKLRHPRVTKNDRVRLKVSTDAGTVDVDISLAP